MRQYASQRQRLNLVPPAHPSPLAINFDSLPTLPLTKPVNKPSPTANPTNTAKPSPRSPTRKHTSTSPVPSMSHSQITSSSSSISSHLHTPKTSLSQSIIPGIELEEGEAERAKLNIVFQYGDALPISGSLGLNGAGAGVGKGMEFGMGAGSFVYEPGALREAFFRDTRWGRPTKRRRVEHDSKENLGERDREAWSVILENEQERSVFFFFFFFWSGLRLMGILRGVDMWSNPVWMGWVYRVLR